MGRITNFAQLGLSDKRTTFIGKPVEQIAKTNEFLHNRYLTNKEAFTTTQMFLNDLQVESQNRPYVENAKGYVNNLFNSTIESNDFAHAENIISQTANKLNNDKYLKGSITSYNQAQTYYQDLDSKVKEGKLDANTTNKLKVYNKRANSAPIEIKPDGTINNIFSGVAVVDDPNLNKQYLDLAKELKTSERPISFGNSSMQHIGNQWYVTGTNKSIDENVAAQNIYQHVLSDPKNQAWLAQEKMLDDADTIKTDEFGNYVKDSYGNLIYDYANVNYIDKMNRIGMTQKDIEKSFETANAADPNQNISLDNKDFVKRQQWLKQLYDNNYNLYKMMPTIQATVGIVDYDETEYKYHQDKLWLAREERSYAQAQKQKDIENLARNTIDVRVNERLPNNIEEVPVVYNAAKQNLENAQQFMNNRLYEKGFIQDGRNGIFATYNDKGVERVGVKYSQNGKVNPINDKTLEQQISLEYQQYYKPYEKELKAVEAYHNSIFNSLNVQDKEELLDRTTNEFLRAFNSQDLDVTQEDVDALNKELKKRVGKYATLSTKGIAYTSGNKEEFKKVMEEFGYGDVYKQAQIKALSKYISKENSALKERVNESLNNLNQISIANIDMTHIPKDYKAAHSAAQQRFKSHATLVTDVDGKNIAQRQSRLVGSTDEFMNAIENDAVTYSYGRHGGKKYIFATYTGEQNVTRNAVGLGFGKKTIAQGKTVMLEAQDNFDYNSELKTSDQILYDDVNDLVVAPFLNTSSGSFEHSYQGYDYEQVEENGQTVIKAFQQPFNIIYQRLPLDVNGNILNDDEQEKARTWGYRYIIRSNNAEDYISTISSTPNEMVKTTIQNIQEYRNKKLENAN